MNSVMLRKLGFGADDRVVIIHADDVGMCQATLCAFVELIDYGLVSCGSLMVPCPWFPATTAYCRSHAEVDVGVHLTLTSEFKTYRWGPISTRHPESGLLDSEGYLPRRSEDVQELGQTRAVFCELRSQLELALAEEIDVSHLDSHMGTVFHPRFLSGYLDLALAHHLPLVVPRLNVQQRSFSADLLCTTSTALDRLERAGAPIFDRILGLPLNQTNDRLEAAEDTLAQAVPGLNLLIVHPAVDGQEIRTITPTWSARVADYQTFLRPELREYVRTSGLQIIGYRALREAMRNEESVKRR